MLALNAPFHILITAVACEDLLNGISVLTTMIVLDGLFK